MQSFEQVSIFNSCIPSMSSLILDNTVVNLYLSEQMLLLNDRLTVQLFSREQHKSFVVCDYFPCHHNRDTSSTSGEN